MLILFPLIAIVSIPKLTVVKFCTEALTYGSLCLNQGSIGHPQP